MYKEIVTKAILGKGKKLFRNKYETTTINKVDSILGCWVINHEVDGFFIDNDIKIRGSFDTNIWYSYDDNSKTAVEVVSVNYEEIVNMDLDSYSGDNEVNIRVLKNPTVVDVSVDNNVIEYEIEKELGVEVIGETKVKIEVLKEESDDYEELDNELTDQEINRVIDAEIKENYL